MASVSTYLNFNGNTEEAFNFYKNVFETEFFGQGIMRMGDIPSQDGMPPMSEEQKKMVMHVELKILGCHNLMGTDAHESMGFNVIRGNNVHINLSPDTRDETRKLFNALSEGGTVTQPLEEMFWGDYYGSCTDKFGILWMFNCSEKV